MANGADRSAAAVLRRAAERAMLAPSIHNTQPWWLVIRGDSLEVWADTSRQLAVLDPQGRQMTLSCGCALMNARVALAAMGYAAIVERLPDPTRPELLARLTLPERRGDWVSIGALDEAIPERRTNRRQFAYEKVPPDVVYDLVAVARSEGAVLLPITNPEHLKVAARLSRRANEIESADPAYLAELTVWTTDDPLRRDGVPAAATPYAGGTVHSHDELAIREFDTRGSGWLPSSSESGTDQCLLLLGTMDNDPVAWLRAGEALEHLWLELTRLGFAASPFTQVVEVAQTHERLRQELRLEMHPEVLLRVGLAPEAVATLRRSEADVISEID